MKQYSALSPLLSACLLACSFLVEDSPAEVLELMVPIPRAPAYERADSAVILMPPASLISGEVILEFSRYGSRSVLRLIKLNGDFFINTVSESFQFKQLDVDELTSVSGRWRRLRNRDAASASKDASGADLVECSVGIDKDLATRIATMGEKCLACTANPISNTDWRSLRYSGYIVTFKPGLTAELSGCIPTKKNVKLHENLKQLDAIQDILWVMASGPIKCANVDAARLDLDERAEGCASLLRQTLNAVK